IIEARESCKQAKNPTKKRGNQVNNEVMENCSNSQNLKMATKEVEIEQVRGKEKEDNQQETTCRVELPSQLEIDSAIEAISNGTVMASSNGTVMAEKNKTVGEVEKLKTVVQEWEEG
ncbi:hypothetical protein A4A49_64174, partial [Nicotiana attenuata]